MYPDLDQIDVHLTLDWREQHKMLKLRFPVNLQGAAATFEIPYGQIERPANGDEEPFQSWVDLSGMAQEKPYGFSLLNDGKYSLDVNGIEIGLTVLRSPVYAHHIPHELQPERDYPYMDQGIQRFQTLCLIMPDMVRRDAVRAHQLKIKNQMELVIASPHIIDIIILSKIKTTFFDKFYGFSTTIENGKLRP